jgi:hypothetical protein
MKIAKVNIDTSILEKHDPEWKFALAASPRSQGWVCSITAEDGTVGYGYGSAMAHYGAPLEAVKANLDRFSSRIIGKDSRKITSIMDELDHDVVGNNQAKSAIDCALHDLLARRLGIPICELFGGPAVTEIASLRILPIKSPEKMAANARKLVNEDVKHLKIKVHGNVKEDVACVAAIREEVGPDIHLTIDANQSYTVKNAIKAIRLMEPFDIELAEQPVAAGDLYGLKKVTDSVSIPVEADEAAYSLEQIALIVRERIADSVSLKLSKIGGLRKTYAAAMICEAGGVKYRMGAHSGPRLLAAHASQLAAALPNIWYASELSEFEGLIGDPWEGMILKDGTIHVTDAPGCGVLPKANSIYPRK